MADLGDRWPDNVPGEYYVDDQCIDCDLCREICADCFARQNDGGYSYVKHQPETDEERNLCLEAMEMCPVSAIGNDGKNAKSE
ncbi:MAG: ferredoxin [Puniceicoccales bacterium]|jgi:ferredoxin|nr:ferredoxin [Puniceicoccales bacterium]